MADPVSLTLKAGAAFGDGEHETTRLALAMIDLLLEEGREFGNILDMGCGSGLLSLMAAMRWQASVLAVDLDPVAVMTARENIDANQMSDRITVLRSDGYAHETIHNHAPYDLIVCNIIAEPIIRLARDAARNLAPGGVLVLSGVLHWLAPQVLEAHPGLVLIRALGAKDWRALALTQS